MHAVGVPLAIAAAIGCASSGAAGGQRGPAPRQPTTPLERMVALLPEGAQLIAELDLARLRANPVVSPLVMRLQTGEAVLATRATEVRASDLVVVAAYGLGTSEAFTVMIASSRDPIPGATPLAGDNLYVLGPADHIAVIEARAAEPIDRALAPGIAELRDHAMPPTAPGAAFRLAARLPFDARVALARITGVESAPAQLSLWADVADDFAVILDAEASDPGDRSSHRDRTAARLEATLRGAASALADEPLIRTLGLSASIADARWIRRGSWVRAIIAVGPRHLERVVERALAHLTPSP